MVDNRAAVSDPCDFLCQQKYLLVGGVAEKQRNVAVVDDTKYLAHLVLERT